MKSHELVERINNGKIKDGTKIKVKNINDDSAYVPRIEYIGNSLKYSKGTYEDGDFVSNSVLFNKNFEFEIVEEKGWFKPTYEERYWAVSEFGNIFPHNWTGSKADLYVYNNHNVFRSEDEAQEYLDYTNALKEAEKPFEMNKDNYRMYYEFCQENICLERNSYIKVQGATYLGQDKKVAQAFIDKWHDEILKYEFDVWE